MPTKATKTRNNQAAKNAAKKLEAIPVISEGLSGGEALAIALYIFKNTVLWLVVCRAAKSAPECSIMPSTLSVMRRYLDALDRNARQMSATLVKNGERTSVLRSGDEYCSGTITEQLSVNGMRLSPEEWADEFGITADLLTFVQFAIDNRHIELTKVGSRIVFPKS